MARRSAGTGARTPTASPPGARPAAPCRSGPAPARPPWRPSAGTATTTDAVVASVGKRCRAGPPDDARRARALSEPDDDALGGAAASRVEHGEARDGVVRVDRDGVLAAHRPGE